MADPLGVLFDVDGTLVDTGYIHTVCWWQAFRQAGHDALMSEIHRSIGMGADILVAHVLGDQAASEADDLAAAHDALYSIYWPSLRVLPGARELVTHCHDRGLVTVLASSAGQREVDVLRAVLRLDSVIDHATSADDADTSKPAPDLVLAGLAKAGLDPGHAVFVGDAVWDVEASAKAGVPCIGLECGGTSAAELNVAGAAQTYKDCAELLADWQHSILATASNDGGEVR